MYIHDFDIKNIILNPDGLIINIDPQTIVNQMNMMQFFNLEKPYNPEIFNVVKGFKKGIVKTSTFRNEVKNYLKIIVNDVVFDEIWESMLFGFPRSRVNLVKQLQRNPECYVCDLQLRYGYRILIIV